MTSYLSEVSCNSLQLQLYRDSRDRARRAPPRSSLLLAAPLALHTGFTVDKESHTWAVLSADAGAVVAAVESRDRLLQWRAKLTTTLGDEHSWMVQLVQVPGGKVGVPTGPARLHIRDHRLTLTANCPPKLLATWHTADLRRYGVLGERLVWEGGTRAGVYKGLWAAMYSVPHVLAHALDMAVRGMMARLADTGARPMSRNASVSWMRDGSVLQLSSSADLAGECVSLAGCDTFGAHTVLNRHPSAAGVDAYATRTTGSSGSSSGGSVGDDGGWWAAAWASGRGWQGAQINSDSIYDTPKGTPCSPVHTKVMSRSSSNRMIESQASFRENENKNILRAQKDPMTLSSIALRNNQHCCVLSQTQDRDADGMEQKTPTNVDFHQQSSFLGSFSSTNVTSNPMENYDVPRPLAETFYDTPKKFFGGPVPVQRIPGSSCSSVLGWAGSLVCGRRVQSQQQATDCVKVNGEGRMPVVDASTGVLLHQPLQVQHQHVQGDLYAVVNKGKSVSGCSSIKGVAGKPRAPSPPHNEIVSQNLKPSVSEHNYVNITPHTISSCANTPDPSKFCNNCHGLVTSTFQQSSAYNEAESRANNNANCNELINNQSITDQLVQNVSVSSSINTKLLPSSDIHYIVMKPASEALRHQQSHYICMASPSLNSSTPTVQSYETTSLPRHLSTSRFRHASPHSTGAPLSSCPYACSTMTSSASSNTLCYSNLSYLIDDANKKDANIETIPNHKKAMFVPRSGRSLSLARTENPYVHGRPRSNSADSRMGETDIWGSEPLTPLNTPPISPRRRRRKSGKASRFGKHRRRDHQLPGEGDSGCDLQEAVLRRSSSAPGKTANRDSASSNDSGVSESLRSYYTGHHEHLRHMDLDESETLRPLDLMLASPCLHASLPRLKTLALNTSRLQHHCHHGDWCKPEGGSRGSGESSSGGTSAAGSRGMDGRSSTSDTSDYHDTLSLTSTLSAEHDRPPTGPHTTVLRPRTGRDYTRLDRSKLQQALEHDR